MRGSGLPASLVGARFPLNLLLCLNQNTAFEAQTNANANANARILTMLNHAVSSAANTVPTPKQFRHDINGLRAIAVVAVVLYHFGIPGFSGGFVGVDVFFVISGFLMTSIIVSGLERGNFSLWGFYLARARRIVPALLVLCASLLLLGWFWLPSTDYQQLAMHVATALAFVSNIKFWREAGYFDTASHDKWLLHTWSLSVEWQFYILLPLGCLLVWRLLGKRALQWTLLALGVGSLLLSLYASQRWPGAAFYLLPTRAWEMLAGGLVWWLTRQHRLNSRLSALLEGVGLLLIGLAIVLFDTSLAWPGPAALVPVLGAMLVLGAQRQDSVWTANPLSRRLGASSYSIYLWHWPLVVTLTYASEQHNQAWISAGLLLTLLLGEASLRWVENPARKGLAALTSRQQIRAVILVVSSLAALAGVIQGAKSSWMATRVDSAVELAANEALNFNPRTAECLLAPGNGFKSPLCRYGKGGIEALVIGDSHTSATVSAVAATTPGATLELSYAGCSTVLGLERITPKSQCVKFNDGVINLVNSKFTNQKIFVVNRSAIAIFGFNETDAPKPDSYFDKVYETPNAALNKKFSHQLVETICSIKNSDRVYLVRPIPEMVVNVPKTISRSLLLGREDPQVSISLADYHARQQVVWAAQDEAASRCGVHILDPLPYLCHAGRCWGSKAGRPIYKDDNHLSEYGNKLLVPMFKQAWAKG